MHWENCGGNNSTVYVCVCVAVGHTRLYLAGNWDAGCRAGRGAGGCRVFNVSSKTRFYLISPNCDISTVVTGRLLCCLRVPCCIFFAFRNSRSFKTPTTVVVNTVKPANTLLPSCVSFVLFYSHQQQMIPGNQFLMPDIIQQGRAVPFCHSVTAAF